MNEQAEADRDQVDEGRADGSDVGDIGRRLTWAHFVLLTFVFNRHRIHRRLKRYEEHKTPLAPAVRSFGRTIRVLARLHDCSALPFVAEGRARRARSVRWGVLSGAQAERLIDLCTVTARSASQVARELPPLLFGQLPRLLDSTRRPRALARTEATKSDFANE